TTASRCWRRTSSGWGSAAPGSGEGKSGTPYWTRRAASNPPPKVGPASRAGPGTLRVPLGSRHLPHLPLWATLDPRSQAPLGNAPAGVGRSRPPARPSPQVSGVVRMFQRVITLAVVLSTAFPAPAAEPAWKAGLARAVIT